jgi:hypothetical protein
MKNKIETTEVVDLKQRGKDYLELNAYSNWIDTEFFKAESPYEISDKFWRASQNNLRKLKGVVKDFEDFKTDVSKAWKKNIGFNEELYEKGTQENKKKENEKKDEKSTQYVAEVDTLYRLHMKSDEIEKEFDTFYEKIEEIDFFKVDADVVEKLEVPFEIIYLVEKYYKK